VTCPSVFCGSVSTLGEMKRLMTGLNDRGHRGIGMRGSTGENVGDG
jgi:hypothetical protein